ncbi:diguanylate cyclase (GGDEF)-like protein [Herbaspirillum rubrisubalbicans]|uniref:GGDEF domain-containing protein n=1 Tax=Herbaspirillum rubrisubalbicans TaxID=80842 RepID=UPI00209E8350|nr:GGDEF domain-containing protein [Herbaspirillum rubrisubalbicans]MCP1572003.1 diguanylate cyclase (GGDEF)-like protein [Herbaspirillum rubrisubalbicans]
MTGIGSGEGLRFRAEDVYDHLNGGLIMLDTDWTVLLWNAWVARYSGVPAQQALQARLTSLFAEPLSPALLRALDNTLGYGLPAVLSSALHRSPLPLYLEPAAGSDMAAARMVQSVVLTPIDNQEGERLCLIQISDASNSVRREKMLRSHSEALKRQAGTDGLTGIHNRRHFDEHYAQALQRAREQGGTLSLFMIDVDFFKQYNDHYGHGAGDHVLKGVAAALRSQLRQPGDLLARYGGEEFILLMQNLSLEQASQVGQALRQAVYQLHEPHVKSLVEHRVTISVGVCTSTVQEDEDGHLLMAAADAALYRAKLGGRNKVVAID